MSSCDWGFTFEAMRVYHDTEWGVPVHDDRIMFEHLMMEAMQCGLSWSLMIKKREIFRACFDGFDYINADHGKSPPYWHNENATHKEWRYREIQFTSILQKTVPASIQDRHNYIPKRLYIHIDNSCRQILLICYLKEAVLTGQVRRVFVA